VLDGTLAEVRRTQDDDGVNIVPAAASPEAATAGQLPEPSSHEHHDTEASTPGTRPAAAPDLPREPSPSDRTDAGDKRKVSLSRRTLIVGGVAVAVVLLVLIVLLVANFQTRTSPSANPAGGQGQGQARAGGGIDVDDSPVTSEHGLRLTGLQAASRRDPESPKVGDTVTVSYALTNTTDQPLQFEYTFVGVRDPAGEDKDTEDMNEGRAVAPGETINAQGRVLLSAAGTWELWPCYLLSGDRFCPDKWQVFFVLAE
jgi:hypothetical protein